MLARAAEVLHGILYRILLHAATTEVRDIEINGADVIVHRRRPPRQLNRFQLPKKVDQHIADAILMSESTLKSMVFLPSLMRKFFTGK
jgi:hypothetical protein